MLEYIIAIEDWLHEIEYSNVVMAVTYGTAM